MLFNDRLKKISASFLTKLTRRSFNFGCCMQFNAVRFYSNNSQNPFEEQQALWKQYSDYLSKRKEEEANKLNELTHIDRDTNQPRQIDVSAKQTTNRVACASGYIQLNKTAFDALCENRLKKGNALIVAQLAGIQASKHTSMLVPLCHQIMLDMCEVNFETDINRYRVICKAICKTSMSKTGVEMEALTACSVALLTVYDMCKAVQKDATINDIKLDYKSGGKSDFKRDI